MTGIGLSPAGGQPPLENWTKQMPPGQGKASGSIPLGRLAEGEYLLTVDAAHLDWAVELRPR